MLMCERCERETDSHYLDNSERRYCKHCGHPHSLNGKIIHMSLGEVDAIIEELEGSEKLIEEEKTNAVRYWRKYRRKER